MPKTKLYAERDIENLPMYAAHVSAMTAEGLGKKAHIAAELAYRDDQIQVLYIKLNEAEIRIKAADAVAVDKFAENMESLSGQQGLGDEELSDEVMIAVTNTCARLARLYAKKLRK